MAIAEYSADGSQLLGPTAPGGADGSTTPPPAQLALLEVPLPPLAPCGWCGRPLPHGRRVDAETCDQACRQSRWRFLRWAPKVLPAAAPPLRFAYADPPYPGKAGYYVGHPDYGGEVDHASLVDELVDGYPDGWALSTSSAALPAVLALCPPTVRVACWVRGERPTKAHRALAAWEPVILSGGRQELRGPAAGERRADVLIHHARPRTTDPGWVIGAKPARFLWWLLLDLLVVRPGDELVDLFPGSGGVGRAMGHLSGLAAAGVDG